MKRYKWSDGFIDDYDKAGEYYLATEVDVLLAQVEKALETLAEKAAKSEVIAAMIDGDTSRPLPADLQEAQAALAAIRQARGEK